MYLSNTFLNAYETQCTILGAILLQVNIISFVIQAIVDDLSLILLEHPQEQINKPILAGKQNYLHGVYLYFSKTFDILSIYILAKKEKCG